ncbi:MAG: hypothetical protein FXF47_04990 [Candidatus Mcinerneyibacterium aminivorans]|uniref:Uncharacterized protein n=1 Tax=Candidatus Mcinerneyibacterium aminivorans TaxID=2703815 RepID=A0A5D0MIF9_9BACT|nr:MAG: hypothetical protein FXF47_04990 [Candidatus Mcinerneyibacterium aminivorans]
MKKYLLIFVVLIFVVGLSAEDYDFRNVNWGMSKTEVKRREDAKLFQDKSTSLAYKTQLKNHDALLVYNFWNNKLAGSAYSIIDNYLNKNNYIEDYKELKRLLEKKYGNPSYEDIIWKNDLYKDDPSHYGMAISVGHLIYTSRWKTNSEKIVIILDGENYKVSLMIAYYSNQYAKKILKDDEKEAMEDL